jgi:hypothetical protein
MAAKHAFFKATINNNYGREAAAFLKATHNNNYGREAAAFLKAIKIMGLFWTIVGPRSGGQPLLGTTTTAAKAAAFLKATNNNNYGREATAFLRARQNNGTLLENWEQQLRQQLGTTTTTRFLELGYNWEQQLWPQSTPFLRQQLTTTTGAKRPPF